MTATTWAYRPGLDGVRCVAVLLVVGFHSQVPWLANGFIGVDVFFVLSGFLVTSVVLHGGLDDFGFGAFYGRRVRRLLPAAIAAVIGTCLLALLYLPRLTRTELIGDARAALLYVANWHFIRQSTDYFADDIGSSPFLHYWSLAIEEQFYLLYPFVLVTVYRLARRSRDREQAIRVLAGALAALAVLSLLSQIVSAGRDPLRAYYGTDARLYQLLIGGAVATVLHLRRHTGTSIPARLAGPAGAAALAAVVLISTDLVSISVSNRGIVAAVASLLLVVAIDSTATSPVATFLGLRPLRYMGQVSYMIYLVHWPLVLVLRDAYDLDPLVLALVVAAGSTVVAAISNRFLEQPIRRDATLARLPRATVAGGLTLSMLAAVAVVPPILRSDVRPPIRETSAFVVDDPVIDASPPPEPTASLPPEPTPSSGEPSAEPEATAEPEPAATPTPTATPDENAEVVALLGAAVPADLDYETAVTSQPGYTCRDADPTDCAREIRSGARIHLLGDSNASMFRPMLMALAADQELTFAESSYQGCPWQLYLGTDRTPEECPEIRQSWYDRFADGRLTADVIIAANLGYEFEARPNQAYWTPVGEGPVADLDDFTAMREMVAARTIASLDALAMSGATIVLVEPLGYNDAADPTACLSGAATVGECAFTRPEPSPITEIYRSIAAERDDVVSLDLDRFACPYLPVCLPLVDGHIVYKDPTHLSIDYTVPERAQFWQLLIDSGVVAAQQG